MLPARRRRSDTWKRQGVRGQDGGALLPASRREKQRLLDEFCQVTDYHSKSAIRVLNHGRATGHKRSGRPKMYGDKVVKALLRLW